MGISSHPPREFSLTSAGTKSPGQVTTKFMERPLFAATRILARLLGARNDLQKPVIATRRAIPAIQSGPKRDSFQFVKKMPFRSAIAIRKNELAVAIFRAWAIERRISDIRHIPPLGERIRQDLWNGHRAALAIFNANGLTVIRFFLNPERAVRQIQVPEHRI